MSLRANAPATVVADPRSEREDASTAMHDHGEIDSRTLFAGLRRRVIVHQGERYCLQLTRAGKLLLTK